MGLLFDIRPRPRGGSVPARGDVAPRPETVHCRCNQATRNRHAYLAGCGNGLRRNPTLCKVIEDRFGLPLRIPAHREEAAFGAALCAGVGLDLYPDFLATGRMIRYLPN